MNNNCQSNRILTLIFKPSLNCNLRCKYCYATDGERTVNLSMTKDQIANVFSWFAQYCQIGNYSRIQILWHGGEPLLIDPETMVYALEKGLEIFNINNIVCNYKIQSNLVNINPVTIDIIKKYFGSNIGGSLDYKVDARVFKNGNNSFDVVLNNIKKLKMAGIRVGVITTLCPSNIDKLDQLYLFFKNNHLSFKPSDIFTTQYNKDVSRYQLSSERYVEGIKHLFDIWFDDKNNPVHISTFLDMSVALLTGKSKNCTLTGECQAHYISVSPDGSLYPCGRFGNDKYILGNITQISPEDYYKLSPKQKLIRENVLPPHCMNCEYFSICNGGCLYRRIVTKDSDYCVIKEIYMHIEHRLKYLGFERNLFKNISPEKYLSIIKNYPNIGVNNSK